MSFPRRDLLRFGVVAACAAVVAACTDDREPPEGEERDITLLRTGSSLEALLVQTYDKIIVSGVVTTPALTELVQAMRDHHQLHRDRLDSATEDAGGEVYRNPNPSAQEDIVDPELPALKDEAGVIALATTLETLAAETYAVAAGILSAPDLRQAIMAIGGSEARHLAALSALIEPPPALTAFLATDAALGPQSYV